MHVHIGLDSHTAKPTCEILAVMTGNGLCLMYRFFDVLIVVFLGCAERHVDRLSGIGTFILT